MDIRTINRKGGNPKSTVPIYMVLGESPEGDFDIRADLQKNACEIKIPMSALDVRSISFTYPDSMYELIYNDAGKIIDGKRTNTPKIYTYDELPALIKQYNIYGEYLHYIEAQVWDSKALKQFWETSCNRVSVSVDEKTII